MDNILIGKDKINIFFYYVFLDYILPHNKSRQSIRIFFLFIFSIICIFNMLFPFVRKIAGYGYSSKLMLIGCVFACMYLVVIASYILNGFHHVQVRTVCYVYQTDVIVLTIHTS